MDIAVAFKAWFVESYHRQPDQVDINYEMPQFLGGYRAGIEAAAKVADEERISMQLAGERAYVAKRYNIADHRYSDSDTAKRISERIRALLEKQP